MGNSHREDEKVISLGSGKIVPIKGTMRAF